jgi:perosamine synthetase
MTSVNEFIPIAKPFISTKEEEYVLDAVRSGWVSSSGAYIDRFEAAFAEYCGVAHAVAVSNGTCGLHLALACYGIGPGDEVIVPDITFIASANAVAYTGARPVLVDVDPDTLCISASAVERAISPRTKAIMPVHLYGHPADMDPLLDLARKHNLIVIEDAAEAHGAEYKQRRAGGLGHCGVFSFFGNKIITTGEGGMLTTNDPEIDRKARMLRSHGMDPSRKYWHNERGFNYRMTNIQAALGVAQMEQIDKFVARREQLLQWYRQFIETSGEVRLNHQANWAKCAHWMVCLEADWFDEARRARFMDALRSRGIDSRPYFYPISSMGLYHAEPTPVAARKAVTGINLPTYYELSHDDVERIGGIINEELLASKDRSN